MLKPDSPPIPAAILSATRVLCARDCSSTKRALEHIAGALANSAAGLDHEQLLHRLVTREKIASTAIGHGVAVPHCRAANCPGILGQFLKLSTPIEFDAPDGRSVDLLFALVVPEEETSSGLHQRWLEWISQLMSSKGLCVQLRAAPDETTLLHHLAAAMQRGEPAPST